MMGFNLGLIIALTLASSPLTLAHPALYSPCLVNVSQFSAGELIASGPVAETINTLEKCDNSCIEEETCKYFTWDQITTECQWYNGDFASASGTEKLCTVSGIAKCTSAMVHTDIAGLIDQCSSAQACPIGWTLKEFDGSKHCYYHETTFMSWTAAESNCVRKGGLLASVHSQEEQDFLQTLEGSPWIGLHDSAVEGTFVWTDGTEVDFTAWEGGEPDAQYGASEDSVYMEWTSGQWADNPSSWTGPSICKKQPT